MTDLHPSDAMLQKMVPTVMVPLNGIQEPLSTVGHRFLAGADGLWMEVRQTWLHAVVPLALQYSVPMPYGRLRQTALIKSIPYELIRAFQDFARDQLPNECAAHIILNNETGTMRLQKLQSISAGRGHVNVVIEPLSDQEVLVLDIHSHGYFAPKFSGVDDRDDCMGVKLAGVISFIRTDKLHNDPPRCTAVFRLCLNGKYIGVLPECRDNHYHFSIEGEKLGTSPTS